MRYLRLNPNDPYETFGWSVGISRLAMRDTYDRAFAVYDKSLECEREHHYESARVQAPFDPFQAQMQGWTTTALDAPFLTDDELQELHNRAVAQDYHADYLAGVLILFADSTIQRFGRKILNKPLGLKVGFGHDYGSHRGPALYTFVVRAAANVIRHVGEWDDTDWNGKYGTGVIYPKLDDASQSDRTKIESIEVLQRAMGLGLHERFRDVVSMRALILIDGMIDSQHSYDRFEERLFEAARAIAAAAGGNAPALLEEQLALLASTPEPSVNA